MISQGSKIAETLKLFISYRRSDSEETAGRIYDRLVEEFGKEAVFRDIDTIPLKKKFADEIREWLQNASVVVAVIGLLLVIFVVLQWTGKGRGKR